MSLGPFHIIDCPVVRPSLLGPLGGRVVVQLVSQLLFNRIPYWLQTGVRLYEAAAMMASPPIQRVHHHVILVS